MFAMMPRQWTPVLPLTALTGKLLPVELAGERLVLFRDAAGAWHALLDRCPHRSAALSLGSVTPQGELRCRYHGWHFAGDGRCTRVPLNPVNEAALAKIWATAVPVRQLAGMLWIFTGTATDAEPVLPESLQGPVEGFGVYCQEWRAHWTRAVENFIDFAHPPYLHQQTIGAYSHDFAERGGQARIELTETPDGFMTLNFMGGRGYGFRVDWHRPNLSCLHFGATPDSRLHVFSVPVNPRLTRVMTVRRLPPGTSTVQFAERAAQVDHTILEEDRLVVESQPGAVDCPEEISVASDGPSLAFRRWYRELVAGGGQDG